MKSIEEKNVRPVVLPEGNFSDSDDCCGDCDYADDDSYKPAFIGPGKILCKLDGKWHSTNDCCSHFE